MTINVALWSKYPSGYVIEKIEPKLLERGIKVKKHLSVRSKDIDLSDIDCVLFMFELSSHAEINRLDVICKDKPKYPLSRKTSNWERDLKFLPSFGRDTKGVSHSQEARERQIALEQTLEEAAFESTKAETERGELAALEDIGALEFLYEEETQKLRERIRQLETENSALKELAIVVEQASDQVHLKLKKKFDAYKDIVSFYMTRFKKSAEAH